jgi:hypothetical protein
MSEKLEKKEFSQESREVAVAANFQVVPQNDGEEEEEELFSTLSSLQVESVPREPVYQVPFQCINRISPPTTPREGWLLAQAP